ncbi:hypothetical protein [Trueperella pyogenes]|uniref:hypothetical protein n=1 Tax=Trueperella pyogenes TaxID=1661 RepID=UPI0024BFF4F0|nr:hypothetical protein [Trueperella pyogenes]WHU57054.1 hypothetical protein QEV10_10040 [Trueperella pyogenes]
MFRKYPLFLMTLAPETPGGSGGQDNESAEAEQDTTAATATEDSNEDEVDDVEEADEWDRERSQRKIRKINAENKRLRERAKQAEDAATTAKDVEAKAASLEAENLRLRVALELGLPDTLANRLRGATREELITDAQALLEMIGSGAPKSSRPRNRVGETRNDNKTPTKPVTLDDIASGFMND